MSILCHYLLTQYVTCHFSDINHVTLTINKSVPNCAILNKCMTHTHTVVTKISTTPSGIPSVGFISSPLKKNDQRNNTFSKYIENKEKIYNFLLSKGHVIALRG